MECHICHKQFSTKKILTRHINTVHSGNLFACVDCNKSFNHKYSLNRHKEICANATNVQQNMQPQPMLHEKPQQWPHQSTKRKCDTAEPAAKRLCGGQVAHRGIQHQSPPTVQDDQVAGPSRMIRVDEKSALSCFKDEICEINLPRVNGVLENHIYDMHPEFYDIIQEGGADAGEEIQMEHIITSHHGVTSEFNAKIQDKDDNLFPFKKKKSDLEFATQSYSNLRKRRI